MEDILVKIPSAYRCLFDDKEFVSVEDMLSIIDDQNNTIEALKEEIRDLKNKENEPDYKDEVIAEQRGEEMRVREMGR